MSNQILKLKIEDFFALKNKNDNERNALTLHLYFEALALIKSGDKINENPALKFGFGDF